MEAVDAILDYAMKLLREEEDRFVWVENGREGLAALLDVVFSLDCDPAPLLDELLRLAAALETNLCSPEAGALLMAVLGTDPRVKETFSRELDRATKELAARWAGSDEARHGPQFGAVAPMGSISARDLLEQRGVRAHLSSR
jgi:hypothetical protein